MKSEKEISSNSLAEGKRFAILATQWYEDVTSALLDGAVAALLKHGASVENIEVFRVPGAFEMPLAALMAAETGRFDGIVCLGAVIRGETPHFEYIAGEAAAGLSTVARETRLPVGFGILTCDTIEQAVERSSPGAGNKGAEAAMAVVEMVNLKARLSA